MQVEQTALAGNELKDRLNTQSLENNLGLSEQTTSDPISEEPSVVSAKPSGTSLNKGFTARGETQHTSLSGNVFPDSKSLDVYTPTVSVVATDKKELSPTSPDKELSENGPMKAMLTTAVTTLNPNSSSAGSKTTVGESNETGRGFSAYLNNPVFMTAATEEKKAEGNVEQSVTAQLSSDEMPTLLPSSRTLDVADDFLAIPAPLVDQTAESEPGTLVPNVASPLQWTAAEGPDFTAKPSSLFTDASLNLEAGPDNGHGGFHATASMVTVPPAVPAPTDDWDDTKVGNISQERGTKQEEIKLDHMVTEPPQTAAGDLGEKDMKGLMPFTASAYATTVNLDENDPAGPSPISVWGKKMSTASADQTVVSVLSTLPADEATAANTVENTEPVEEREHVSLPLPEAVADTQSDVFQTLANTLKGNLPTAARITCACAPVHILGEVLFVIDLPP